MSSINKLVQMLFEQGFKKEDIISFNRNAFRIPTSKKKDDNLEVKKLIDAKEVKK
jgi:hypothetical protein